jgi:hypothetical protein
MRATVVGLSFVLCNCAGSVATPDASTVDSGSTVPDGCTVMPGDPYTCSPRVSVQCAYNVTPGPVGTEVGSCTGLGIYYDGGTAPHDWCCTQ